MYLYQYDPNDDRVIIRAGHEMTLLKSDPLFKAGGFLFCQIAKTKILISLTIFVWIWRNLLSIK